ncbi:hypothetical protein GWK47_013354 [Chionoecetes opilio]|uniref:Uncharacterized protein n=1 Tax=Chionoecetes opilio TaxID=41210 RepID=A0A8J5CNZ1_CHIOP|nr:hypothetical protein GWK47_013354 [Chionoecetes opilio]
MALQLQHVHAQPPKGWLLGHPEPNPCWGKQLPKNGQVLRRFFHFVRVQRNSVKEAASLVTAEVAVVGGESTDPHAEEEPLCGEDPPAVRIMQNLDRSKKRSAKGAARMDPVASCKESTNPWPTESDGVWTRGVLKRSSSPERATTATRSSSGLGAGDEEENGGDDGRDADFFSDAGISAQSACSPKRRRTPIMTPAVAAALDRTRISDRTAVHLFTTVHGADATPARSTVRRHRRSAREKMAKE